jgi:hypothetical protein
LIDVSATHRHRVFPMQIEIAFSARKIWLIASLAERMPLAELRSVATSARLSIVLARRQQASGRYRGRSRSAVR